MRIEIRWYVVIYRQQGVRMLPVPCSDMILVIKKENRNVMADIKYDKLACYPKMQRDGVRR